MSEHGTLDAPARSAGRAAARPRGLSMAAWSKLLIFAAAGLSFVASVYLWFGGEREQGLFVGLWVPSILAAGALLFSGGSNSRE